MSQLISVVNLLFRVFRSIFSCCGVRPASDRKFGVQDKMIKSSAAFASLRSRRALAASLLFTTGTAVAGDGKDGPHWECWYAPQELSVRCLLASAPQSVQPERVALAEAAYDLRLPELVKTIWGRPQELAWSPITIPLWSEPTDREFAALLVSSVMCGVQAACTAAFDENHDGLGELRAAAAAAAAGAPGPPAYGSVELIAAQDAGSSARTVVVD